MPSRAAILQVFAIRAKTAKEGIAPVEFVSQTLTSPTLSYALQSLALRKSFQASLRLPCAKKRPAFRKKRAGIF